MGARHLTQNPPQMSLSWETGVVESCRCDLRSRLRLAFVPPSTAGDYREDRQSIPDVVIQFGKTSHVFVHFFSPRTARSNENAEQHHREKRDYPASMKASSATEPRSLLTRE